MIVFIMKEAECPFCVDSISKGISFCAHCDNSSEIERKGKQQPKRYSISRTKEIALEELRKEDKILIQTCNRAYIFSIIDPARRLGNLSGRRFGTSASLATLAGTLTEGSSIFINGRCGVKTGSRVVFYVESNQGVRRLITSAITRIVRIEA
jgi:hypothetical protein